MDTAPDVVLYRNSASPADNDNLGNIEFRGRNDNSQDHAYAQILARISDASDTTEDGILDIITSSAGVQAATIRVSGDRVGVNEGAPLHPLHVTESTVSTALFVESKENVATSAADVVLYHHRNGNAGQDNDVISSITFRSNNDAGTPLAENYASIVASIVDATDTEEDGKIDLQVQSDGTLTSMAAISAANVTLGARPIIPTHTPASATATGTAGEIAWDASYIYACTASNTWKRAALDTFENTYVFNVRRYMEDNNATSDAAITAAFSWAVSNISGSAPCILFPAGVYTSTAKTLISSGSINDTTQITIKGEGRGDSSEVQLSGSWTINQPVNISGMFFKATADISTLLFRRADTGGDAREDDMDSTISNCVFNSFGGSSSIDIDYRGRNLEVYNCRFKTGGTSGRGIKLSYYNNSAENVVQSTLGWKRILIHGNTFHNYPTSVDIHAPTNFSSGEPRLRGFVFSSNTQETNGTLLNAQRSNVILEGASIMNNTCQVNQNTTALIAFSVNKFYYSTFVGNTVFGNPGQTRFARLLDATDAKGSIINDNIVHMCDSGGGITGTYNGCRISGNIGTAPSGSDVVNVSGTNSLDANQDVVYSTT